MGSEIREKTMTVRWDSELQTPRVKIEDRNTAIIDKTINEIQLPVFTQHKHNSLLSKAKRFLFGDQKMMKIVVRKQKLYVKIKDIAAQLHQSPEAILEMTQKQDIEHRTRTILKHIEANLPKDKSRNEAPDVTRKSTTETRPKPSERTAKAKTTGSRQATANSKQSISRAESLAMAESIFGKSQMQKIIDQESTPFAKKMMENTFAQIGRELNGRDLSKPFGLKPSRIHHKFIYSADFNLISVTKGKTSIKLPLTDEFKMLKDIELSNELDNLK